MKKIDYYIIRNFLGAFVYALILFVVIAVVMDLSEKVDDFIEESVPFNVVVVDYYLNFLPYIGMIISPILIFITVIFASSKMAYNSEIIAILSTGTSFSRILVPFFISAGIITLMLLYASHFLVPQSNKQRIDFENTYLHRHTKKYHQNIHMQIAPNTYIYMGNYNSHDSAGYQFTLEKVEELSLTYKLKADKIIWRPDKKEWTLTNYLIRTFDGFNDKIQRGVRMDTTLPVKPTDFEQKEYLKTAMTTPELNDFIDEQKLKGAENLEFYLVEKHRRTANPFAAFILVLIGVSIASRKVRGGRGLHIAIGIAISAVYVLLMQFSTTFSTNAGLPPLLGVWIPNLIFMLISLFIFRIAPK